MFLILCCKPSEEVFYGLMNKTKNLSHYNGRVWNPFDLDIQTDDYPNLQGRMLPLNPNWDGPVSSETKWSLLRSVATGWLCDLYICVSFIMYIMLYFPESKAHVTSVGPTGPTVPFLYLTRRRIRSRNVSKLTAKFMFRIVWLLWNLIATSIAKLMRHFSDFTPTTHLSLVLHICQWIRSALVKIMACCLFDTKPLSKPMLGIVNWTSRNRLQ